MASSSLAEAGEVGRGHLLRLCHLLGPPDAWVAQLRLQAQLQLRCPALLPGLAPETLLTSWSWAAEEVEGRHLLRLC